MATVKRACTIFNVSTASPVWRSWAASTGLGLLGALVGYGIFTGVFGIGDDDKFDWGGIVGAVIGAIIVVAVGSWAIKKFVKSTV